MAEIIVPQSSQDVPAGKQRSSKATIWLTILSVMAIGMFAFAYLNAQFFVMLCQEVGLLTKSADASRGAITEVEGGRPLDVYFAAHVNDNMPIAFSVRQSYQKTAVGKRAIVDYRFVNTSRETIYFRPVHDVFPTSAGRDDILTLEECFCFTEQKIGPGESYTMPVVYSFSDKLDPKIETIRMSYSLHPSTKELYERAMQTLKETPEMVPDYHREAQARELR